MPEGAVGDPLIGVKTCKLGLQEGKVLDGALQLDIKHRRLGGPGVPAYRSQHVRERGLQPIPDERILGQVRQSLHRGETGGRTCPQGFFEQAQERLAAPLEPVRAARRSLNGRARQKPKQASRAAVQITAELDRNGGQERPVGFERCNDGLGQPADEDHLLVQDQQVVDAPFGRGQPDVLRDLFQLPLLGSWRQVRGRTPRRFLQPAH